MSLRDEWIEALESDEYEQCSTALCRTDKDGNTSYCCLGVGADVWMKKNPTLAKWELNAASDGISLKAALIIDDHMMDEQSYNRLENLPSQILEDFQISNQEMYTLVDMNDSRKYSFQRYCILPEKPRSS